MMAIENLLPAAPLTTSHADFGDSETEKPGDKTTEPDVEVKKQIDATKDFPASRKNAPQKGRCGQGHGYARPTIASSAKSVTSGIRDVIGDIRVTIGPKTTRNEPPPRYTTSKTQSIVYDGPHYLPSKSNHDTKKTTSVRNQDQLRKIKSQGFDTSPYHDETKPISGAMNEKTNRSPTQKISSPKTSTLELKNSNELKTTTKNDSTVGVGLPRTSQQTTFKGSTKTNYSNTLERIRRETTSRRNTLLTGTSASRFYASGAVKGPANRRPKLSRSDVMAPTTTFRAGKTVLRNRSLPSSQKTYDNLPDKSQTKSLELRGSSVGKTTKVEIGSYVAEENDVSWEVGNAEVGSGSDKTRSIRESLKEIKQITHGSTGKSEKRPTSSRLGTRNPKKSPSNQRKTPDPVAVLKKKIAAVLTGPDEIVPHLDDEMLPFRSFAFAHPGQSPNDLVNPSVDESGQGVDFGENEKASTFSDKDRTFSLLSSYFDREKTGEENEDGNSESPVVDREKANEDEALESFQNEATNLSTSDFEHEQSLKRLSVLSWLELSSVAPSEQGEMSAHSSHLDLAGSGGNQDLCGRKSDAEGPVSDLLAEVDNSSAAKPRKGERAKKPNEGHSESPKVTSEPQCEIEPRGSVPKVARKMAPNSRTRQKLPVTAEARKVVTKTLKPEPKVKDVRSTTEAGQRARSRAPIGRQTGKGMSKISPASAPEPTKKARGQRGDRDLLASVQKPGEEPSGRKLRKSASLERSKLANTEPSIATNSRLLTDDIALYDRHQEHANLLATRMPKPTETTQKKAMCSKNAPRSFAESRKPQKQNLWVSDSGRMGDNKKKSGKSKTKSRSKSKKKSIKRVQSVTKFMNKLPMTRNFSDGNADGWDLSVAEAPDKNEADEKVTKKQTMPLKGKKKKKGRKRSKSTKRKGIMSALSRREDNEKAKQFKAQFRLYAKFGDRRNSGETISMANTIRWLKQAGVVRSRKVTTNDIEIYFIHATQRRRSLTMLEFLYFLKVLVTEKGLVMASVIESLIACGEPAVSVTDLALESMLKSEQPEQSATNAFTKPLFPLDMGHCTQTVYKSSPTGRRLRKLNNSANVPATEGHANVGASEKTGIPFPIPSSYMKPRAETVVHPPTEPNAKNVECEKGERKQKRSKKRDVKPKKGAKSSASSKSSSASKRRKPKSRKQRAKGKVDKASEDPKWKSESVPKSSLQDKPKNEVTTAALRKETPSQKKFVPEGPIFLVRSKYARSSDARTSSSRETSASTSLTADLSGSSGEICGQGRVSALSEAVSMSGNSPAPTAPRDTGKGHMGDSEYAVNSPMKQSEGNGPDLDVTKVASTRTGGPKTKKKKRMKRNQHVETLVEFIRASSATETE